MGKKKTTQSPAVPALPAMPPAVPIVVVACRCYDNGEFQSEQFLTFASVPRVGEFFAPDKGSLLVVHLVAYRHYEYPGFAKLMLPTLYLRELNADDRARLAKLKVQTD
ncbi:MAG: hypothetical protein U0804_21615 [Gemmataceae bacterium]